MILLFTIAKLANGMVKFSYGHQNNEEVLHRFRRQARILNIKMICAPGMAYIDGRCRKLY